MSANPEFERRFIKECGFKESLENTKVRHEFQPSFILSIPDMLTQVESKNDVLALVCLETKVESPVDEDQIQRHLKGLECRARLATRDDRMTPYHRLVVLGKDEKAPLVLPEGVAWISWSRIHSLLKESLCDDLIGRYLADALARTLEERGMTRFEGFDVEGWLSYTELHRENKTLIERVEGQIRRLVSDVKSRIIELLKTGDKPFDAFKSTPHGRGNPFEFSLKGEELTPRCGYSVVFKAVPEEGWVETSISAEFSPETRKLLENFSHIPINETLKDWSLWSQTRGVERIGTLDSYEDVIAGNPTQAAFILRRSLINESDLFRSEEVFDQFLNDIRVACQVFRRLE